MAEESPDGAAAIVHHDRAAPDRAMTFLADPEKPAPIVETLRHHRLVGLLSSVGIGKALEGIPPLLRVTGRPLPQADHYIEVRSGQYTQDSQAQEQGYGFAEDSPQLRAPRSVGSGRTASTSEAE